MARIPPQDDEDGDANGSDDFRPLTAEEAQKLRLQQPLLSIWRVVLAQVVVGLAVAAFTWLFNIQFYERLFTAPHYHRRAKRIAD